jgi:hypothetical protein
MQFVDNGMFALSMNNPIDVDSDDDDNEVLGATSAKGMPMMREDDDVERRITVLKLDLLTAY